MQPALLAGYRIGRLAGLFLWGSFSREEPFSIRRRENGSIPSGRFQASGLSALWVRSFDSLDEESKVVRKPSGRGADLSNFVGRCIAGHLGQGNKMGDEILGLSGPLALQEQE